ncbi:MAG: hypothetical protein FJ137_19895 [Deltaproteobacteria bacterium]|nr:hypothetical protein [Deltaproteobacteria bacterium]
MNACIAFAVVAGVLLVGGADCGGAAPAPTLTQLKADVFQPRCGATGCHGGTNPARGLDLVTDPHAALVDAVSVVDPAQRYVVAGDVEASLLLKVLAGPVPSPGGDADCRRMPPGFDLADDDVAAVRAWIADGAAND